MYVPDKGEGKEKAYRVKRRTPRNLTIPSLSGGPSAETNPAYTPALARQTDSASERGAVNGITEA
jgi:hypothetical protein